MKTNQRQGFTLIEVLAAVAVLAATGVLAVQFLAMLSHARVLATYRQMAHAECANTLELLRATPWEQLTAEQLADWSLSDEAQAALPGGQVTVEVTEVAEPAPARRLLVRVTWQAAADRPAEQAQLVAWQYAPEEESP